MAAANTLPIVQIKAALLAALRQGNRLLLTAPTGSGKSTQVPQFLLDSGLCSGQLLVLQPRRLAARMLATRVASERQDDVGNEIGYQTRFESRISAATRVRFITEGILPRLLLENTALPGISAVIFDEFHERSLATDLGLALIRSVQAKQRPDLKLIVMSATLNAELLKPYLPDAVHLEADTRQYPIDIRYQKSMPRKPAWELAAEALGDLVRSGVPGDVLIFMPGVYEIRKTMECAKATVRGGGLTFLPLYGDLPPDQQNQVMSTATGRKVIVATNIAETSLTIPGVRHVIDSGLARINRYDSGRGFNMLLVEPVSRNSADQRAGRAGREGPGTCVRLWTQMEQNHRPLQEVPEVRRVDLAETVLQLLTLGFADPAHFPWLEAPTPAAVEAALTLLLDLGAVRQNPLSVTPAGRTLAGFPAHPRLARLLLEAVPRHCLREATLMAAILSERPMVPPSVAGAKDSPLDRFPATLEPEHKLSDTSGLSRDSEQFGVPAAAGSSLSVSQPPVSDFFRLMQALHAAHQAHFDWNFCQRCGINPGAAQQVLRTQAYFLNLARRNGWPHDHAVTGNTGEALLKCLLLAYPDRLAKRRDRGSLVCELRNGRRGELARASATRDAELLVAAEIREVGGAGQAPRTLLSLTGEVREEWLRELFPDQWEETGEIIWNDTLRQVEKRRQVACLGLVLEEKITTEVDPAQAGPLLAAQIKAKNLKLEGWDDATDAWIQRVRWVAETFPERSLIRYDETDTEVIVQELCAGETKFEKVKHKPCLPLVRNMLSWDDQQFVERMAPDQLPLPNGRKMRLRYKAGQPPRGNAKIQDLYELRESPKVGGSRVRVLIEILGPNMRPVQITDDLAGFWVNHYPAVKKTLSRRYPRHEWR